MNTKRGKILVNGSVVLDTISKRPASTRGGKSTRGGEFFGGTGANISYGLGKLKASPMLFSLVGADFKKDFSTHLRKNGVDLRVHVDKKGWTSRFYSETNEKGEQVNIWQANIYKKINKISLKKNIKHSELRQ